MNSPAIEAALSRPGMFHCPNLSTGPATLSEKQCLFQQHRYRVHSFPSSCSPDCERGAEIRRNHAGQKIPDVQYNILQGSYTACNRQVEVGARRRLAPPRE